MPLFFEAKPGRDGEGLLQRKTLHVLRGDGVDARSCAHAGVGQHFLLADFWLWQIQSPSGLLPVLCSACKQPQVRFQVSMKWREEDSALRVRIIVPCQMMASQRLVLSKHPWMERSWMKGCFGFVIFAVHGRQANHGVLLKEYLGIPDLFKNGADG